MASLNRFTVALVLFLCSNLAISKPWDSNSAPSSPLEGENLSPAKEEGCKRGRQVQIEDSEGIRSSQRGSSEISISKKDSLKRAINRDARRASLMSAVVPGLGQVYNRKYWKVPIIYAALGGLGYYAMGFNNDYQNYHHELLFRYDHNLQQVNTYPEYTVDNLITLKKQSQKYRDLCFIGMGIFYVLNIIDANVDAHLKKFDVNDNLSLNFAPAPIYYSTGSRNGFAPGISLALHFK